MPPIISELADVILNDELDVDISISAVEELVKLHKTLGRLTGYKIRKSIVPAVRSKVKTSLPIAILRKAALRQDQVGMEASGWLAKLGRAVPRPAVDFIVFKSYKIYELNYCSQKLANLGVQAFSALLQASSKPATVVPLFHNVALSELLLKPEDVSSILLKELGEARNKSSVRRMAAQILIKLDKPEIYPTLVKLGDKKDKNGKHIFAELRQEMEIRGRIGDAKIDFNKPSLVNRCPIP